MRPLVPRELNGEFRGAGLGAAKPAGDVVACIRRDGRLLNEFRGPAGAAGEEIAAVSRPGFGGFRKSRGAIADDGRQAARDLPAGNCDGVPALSRGSTRGGFRVEQEIRSPRGQAGGGRGVLTGVAASTGPGWPVASAAASSTASVPRIPAPARRDVAVRKAMETPAYPCDADI